MERGTSGSALLLLAGLGVFFLAQGADLATALDLDGIKITPSISYTGEYDDNIFRTQSDKKSDYANIITPAIAVEAKPDKHEIKARYKADILRYSTYNNFDTERHLAELVSIFKFNRVELRLNELFRRTDDFPSSELTSRLKRNENALGGGFDIDLYRIWGVGFDATWENTHYLRSDFDFLSRNGYTYATNLYYRLTAKTRVFGEYDFVREIYEFDKTRDNNRHRGLLGVRGDLTEKLSLTAKGGYERLAFHSDTRDDQDNFVVSIEGNYKPLDRLQIALILSRSVQASTFANNAQYESFNSNLGITYAFTPKIMIIPRFSFGVDNYRESALNPDNNTQENRLDYLLGAGLTIRYEPLKYIRLDGSYDYQGRKSNFGASDYDDNRVSFKVTLSM